MVEESPERTVERLRRAHRRGITKPLAWRLAQLDGLSQLLVDEEAALAAALHADLGKSAAESLATEIGLVRLEAARTRRHLRRWLAPVRAIPPLVVQPATARTVLEPLGVVLIVSTWNYPVQLSLTPLVGALAAGDAVVLKPSEIAPATSRVLAELLPRYLDARAVAVVEGGAEATSALLEERFDLIFFTGGARVGRIVLEAAAKHLTPVVLELGGRSPVYVDASADLEVAADRIAWGKFMNAGQTCIAPDHLLATREVAEALVPRIAAAVRRMHGADPLQDPDYPRIVSERQLDRLVPLLADGRVAVGGRVDRAALRLEPTVLTGVVDGDAVLDQEVFGPILPVVEVADERAAIARVAAGEKPLALYVFTRSAASRRAWTTGTSSGQLVFDVPMLQIAVPGIPFGGVGASGMGSYHGRRSLTTFSHEKAVLAKPLHPDTVRLVAPPYTPRTQALLRRVFR